MKKTIITTTIFIILVLLIIIFKNEIQNQKKKLSLIKAGDTAQNFVLGYNDTKTITLNDFMGKINVILAFLDESPASLRTEKMLETLYKNFILKRKDILLFFLKKTDNFVIIEEKTDYFNLKYRTLFSKIPEFYHFNNMPVLLLIDRYGIIKILYSGYSPTLLQDLQNNLAFIK